MLNAQFWLNVSHSGLNLQDVVHLLSYTVL